MSNPKYRMALEALGWKTGSTGAGRVWAENKSHIYIQTWADLTENDRFKELLDEIVRQGHYG